jgi:hypothetical protein
MKNRKKKLFAFGIITPDGRKIQLSGTKDGERIENAKSICHELNSLLEKSN